MPKKEPRSSTRLKWMPIEKKLTKTLQKQLAEETVNGGSNIECQRWNVRVGMVVALAGASATTILPYTFLQGVLIFLA